MKILNQTYCVIHQIKAKNVCNSMKLLHEDICISIENIQLLKLLFQNCLKLFQNFSAGLWPISKLELNVDFNSIMVFYISNYN